MSTHIKPDILALFCGRQVNLLLNDLVQVIHRKTPSVHLTQALESVKHHGTQRLDSVLFSHLTLDTEQPG